MFEVITLLLIPNLIDQTIVFTTMQSVALLYYHKRMQSLSTQTITRACTRRCLIFNPIEKFEKGRENSKWMGSIEYLQNVFQAATKRTISDSMRCRHTPHTHTYTAVPYTIFNCTWSDCQQQHSLPPHRINFSSVKISVIFMQKYSLSRSNERAHTNLAACPSLINVVLNCVSVYFFQL